MDERIKVTATAFARLLMTVNADCLQFAENIIRNQPSSFTALMPSDCVKCDDDDCEACTRIKDSCVFVAFVNSDDMQLMSDLNDVIAEAIEKKMAARYPTMLQKEIEDNRKNRPAKTKYRV